MLKTSEGSENLKHRYLIIDCAKRLQQKRTAIKRECNNKTTHKADLKIDPFNK